MLYGGDSRTTCDGSAAGVESVAVVHSSTTFKLPSIYGRLPQPLREADLAPMEREVAIDPAIFA